MAEQQTLNGWLARHSGLLSVLLVILASVRIVSTYHVFSQTSDEPAHIAAGMQWLDQGIYQYEPLHPPLARVATALGPFLDGRRSQHNADMWVEGKAILGREPDYDRTLTLARLGILPFFWVACLVVYCWGRRYFDDAVACLAVLIFSMLPAVLAHAGLATTDMALTATLGAAFLAATAWVERPGARTSLLLGLTIALAVLSKLSTLVFLPATGLAAGAGYVLFERPERSTFVRQIRQRLYWLPLILLTSLIFIWAGYRFSVGTVAWNALRLQLPFPELFQGISQLATHNQAGALNYLLGQHSDTGWWYYYLVAFGVKTPLSVLALAGVGCASPGQTSHHRGWWLAITFSGAILLLTMFSHINLGIRHVLPIYFALSLLAAAGLSRLLRHGSDRPAANQLPLRWIAAALTLELVASSVLCHPDYLSYFNPLAGRHPEKILVDSDLDWGQDMKRLALRLQQLGVKQLTFTSCIDVDPDALGLPPLVPMDFLRPSPGWNAVRLTQLEVLAAGIHTQRPEIQLWPNAISPTEKIGKGILLFRFPDQLPPAPAWFSTAHIDC